jgi:hypothetical protein
MEKFMSKQFRVVIDVMSSNSLLMTMLLAATTIILICLIPQSMQEQQLVYSQAPVTEEGIEVNEIDLPEYEDDASSVVPDSEGFIRPTGIQVVEVDEPTLADVQYKNYTLDLDVMSYFNCVSEKSLPLYQLSEGTGQDFRAQSPNIYNSFMEGCLHEQWILIPEGQAQTN